MSRGNRRGRSSEQAVRKQVLIGLGALLVFALHVKAELPNGTATDQTTTLKNGKQTRGNNRHGGGGKTDQKASPRKGKGAPATDTGTTSTESTAPTQSASASGGSKAAGRHPGTKTDVRP